MSLVDSLLSRNVVVYSLILVVGIVVVAISSLFVPVIADGIKLSARRRKAAKLARRKQQGKRSNAKTDVRTKRQKQRKLALAPSEANPANRAFNEPDVTTTETVDLSDADVVPDPVNQLKVFPAEQDEPVVEVMMEASPEVSETPVEPEPVSQETAAGIFDLQNILESVFAEPEANPKYVVLMRGVELVSIDELVTLAEQIAADLRAEPV